MEQTSLPEQPYTGTPMPDLRQARKQFSGSYLLICFYAVVSTALGMGLLRLLNISDLSETSSVNLILQYGLAYLIVFPLTLLLAKFIPSEPPEKKSMKAGQFFLLIPICEFCAISGSLIGTIINVILSVMLNKNTASTFILENIFGESPIAFLIIAIIFAPIVEETLFRKLLIDHIRKYGTGTAVLVSGLLFGFFHGNLTQLFYASALGFLFAFIYCRTGKIQYTICLHICMNFWGTAMPYLLMHNLNLEELQENLLSQDYARILGSLSEMAPLLVLVAFNYALAAAGLVLLLVFFKKFTLEPAAEPLPKGTHFKTICLNLGFLVMLAVIGFRFFQQLA